MPVSLFRKMDAATDKRPDPDHRRRCWVPTALVCCAAVLFSSGANASNRQNDIPPQVKFRSIAPSQMEQVGWINSIAQDSSGFMWFGAMKGLARYDGYEIKVYTRSDQTQGSIPHNWIREILIDSNGNMWAVTYNGPCRYVAEQDSFDCSQLMLTTSTGRREPASVFSMLEDDQGRFWVSTSQGIKLLQPDTGEYLDAPAALQEVLPPLANSEDNFVHDFEQDSDGNLWIGTEGNGVVTFHPDSGELVHYHSDNNNVSAEFDNHIREIMIAENGTVWIGSLGGFISRYNPKNQSFSPLIHSDREKADTVWDIVEDDTGLIWIADGTGVHIYDQTNEQFASYSYIEGEENTPGNFVGREIYIDDTANVWAGYFPSGVDLIDRSASYFVNYSHNPDNENSLADGGVLSTLEAANGGLWIGCGFGLSLFDRENNRWQRYTHDPQNPDSISGSTVLDMAMEDDGTLWVGSWDRGLNRKEPGSEVFHNYIQQPDDPNSLLGREPWGIDIDGRGRLWVATEKGVSRYRRQHDDFEHIMPNDENGVPLPSLYTRHVYADSQNRIWIASFNGLYVYDQRTESYTHHFRSDPDDPNSLSWDQVLVTYEDDLGRIWVGTNGAGLNLYRPDTGDFAVYDRDHGLPDLTITGIIADDRGTLWVSTAQGLARFDEQHQRFTVFDKRDGLISNLFDQTTPSRLSTGELVFGSSRGVTIFDPQKIKPNNHPPPVTITSLSIFNKPVQPSANGALTQAINYADRIQLTHEQSVFSLEFAALNYISPEENQFAYRLRGFEDEWNYVGNRRSATYTNLDPGSYTFEVKASNNNGVWNETPHTLEIEVLPPYWRTPLAYIIYILATLAIIARTWQVQQNKLARERQNVEQERAIVRQLREIDRLKDEINRELDKKVAERTRELEQQHQQLQRAQEELKLLNRKLEHASVTDQLTGLKNRRFLYQVINKDVATINRAYVDAARQGRLTAAKLDDLTFAVIDMDNFKNINDQFGHDVGDNILKQLSSVLEGELREYDYLVRWGGEEFVVVIRNLPRSEAVHIVERIRTHVKAFRFTTANGQIITGTCSIGVAAYPFLPSSPQTIDWEQTIKIADRALYAAKHSGKDCWVYLAASPSLTAKDALAKAINENDFDGFIERGDIKVKSSVEDPINWRPGSY